MGVQETHFLSKSKTAWDKHLRSFTVCAYCVVEKATTMCVYVCTRLCLLIYTSMHVVSVWVCVHFHLSAMPNICISLPVSATEPKARFSLGGSFRDNSASNPAPGCVLKRVSADR